MTNLLDSRKAVNSETPDITPEQSCSAHGILETCISEEASSRRRFLQIAMDGALTSIVTAAGVEFATPHAVLAQSKLSPDAALKELTDGNRRFTSGRLTAPEQDLAILKQNTIDKQESFAALLSCADSRVPVEILFDQSIGHIFVTRVAGNIVTPEIIASLEFGAAGLGTKVILVMGPRQLRSCKGNNSSEGSSRADLRALSAYSACCRSSGSQSRGRNQGKCQDPGSSSATGVPCHIEFAEGRKTPGRGRLL